MKAERRCTELPGDPNSSGLYLQITCCLLPLFLYHSPINCLSLFSVLNQEPKEVGASGADFWISDYQSNLGVWCWAEEWFSFDIVIATVLNLFCFRYETSRLWDVWVGNQIRGHPKWAEKLCLISSFLFLYSFFHLTLSTCSGNFCLESQVCPPSQARQQMEGLIVWSS